MKAQSRAFSLLGVFMLGVSASSACASATPRLNSDAAQSAPSIRIATFNVSMDGSNYNERFTSLTESPLPQLLAKGRHPQIHNVATIIQAVRPDVILLNEFDFTGDWQQNVALFQQNFLAQAHGDYQAISYQYSYAAPVNTGVASEYDFDGNGKKSGIAGDAYGFGFYPGQYGMLLLSRFPIDTDAVRTFQHLPWYTQSGASMPLLNDQPFYDQQTWQAARLSSKSFWDIPLEVAGERLHILASHPTPPVFDGPEDRNGLRNFAELKLVADYIATPAPGYLVDDKAQVGGLSGDGRFVILGDLNAAPQGPKARPEAIDQLLKHPKVDSSLIPVSKGGAESSTEPFAKFYTASWQARVDYVLPSKFGLQPVGSGVYWPAEGEAGYELVRDRKLSSDHRLVWMDVQIIANE
ncbi:endonuclease/exonuclease/phosphatase family protein [Pseudoalteromonas sp. T1lg22]|uniref:endonuclease/exonuclease/phosphatase family protein n=1 Tax=Pseudoalteromonas sp. T1lg22 TaxID=2077096 RepID=UPI001F3A75F0|nr:endonuclease/exonuclease/phosphatase family protein [Pseudoalteromonas sp. T1lg22]